MDKYCPVCCKKSDWSASSTRYKRCRLCYNAMQRVYRKKNREILTAIERRRYKKRRGNPEWVAQERKRGVEYWQQMRHEAIMAYGGYKCACCGETEPFFLSIDHINNDGAEHRRSMGYDGNGKGAGSATLGWMKRNNYPDGFQVLCMNCNHGKARNGGVCPHKILHNQNCVNSGDIQTGQSRAKPRQRKV